LRFVAVGEGLARIAQPLAQRGALRHGNRRIRIH
jgi:hypothetical protein